VTFPNSSVGHLRLSLLLTLEPAEALGINVPRSLTVRADGVIEITTFLAAVQNVCFWHLADIRSSPFNVRF
jgi:hypothetical protein